MHGPVKRTSVIKRVAVPRRSKRPRKPFGLYESNDSYTASRRYRFEAWLCGCPIRCWRRVGRFRRARLEFRAEVGRAPGARALGHAGHMVRSRRGRLMGELLPEFAAVAVRGV